MQQNNFSSSLTPAWIGCCIMCLALGLGRFAYTPLLPEMIKHHWLTHTMAGYAGAANFLGYLFGALIASSLTTIKPGTFWIKLSLYLCVASLFSCTLHTYTYWLLWWRLISGISGALLMVLTPPVIYRSVNKNQIALTSGIMFSGIGLGIIISAVIIPIIANYSLSLTWLTVAAIGALLTAFALIGLPGTQPYQAEQPQQNQRESYFNKTIIFSLVAYLFFGFGSVPHLLYLVEYMELITKSSIVVANIGWLAYGVGNLIGSPMFGYLAKHTKKPIHTLLYAYCIAILSVLILFLSKHSSIIILSYALNGIIANSIVSLTSSLISIKAPPSKQTFLWGLFTIAAASMQALGSTMMVNLANSRIGFYWMFGLAAGTLICASLCVTYMLLLQQRCSYSAKG